MSQIDAKCYEDGDCRYLPRELIEPSEKHSDIRKADIFALGLSAFEAATLLQLPQNGPNWHKIRTEGIAKSKHFSDEIYRIISRMIRENPSERPNAVEIAESETVSNYISNKRLQELLEEEITKNKRLQR